MKLVPPSLPPFGLYCSACFGSLFVSILCKCCSHFFLYCFISFTKVKLKFIIILIYYLFLALIRRIEFLNKTTNAYWFMIIILLHSNYRQVWAIRVAIYMLIITFISIYGRLFCRTDNFKIWLATFISRGDPERGTAGLYCHIMKIWAICMLCQVS